jgi:hypothetical protein
VAREEGPLKIEGRDPSYSETLARVAALMDAEKIDHEHISSMSQESAREFLNDAIIRIAQALGLAAAKAAALVADVLQIARNAGKAFVEKYRTNYERARRISPYEGKQ